MSGDSRGRDTPWLLVLLLTKTTEFAGSPEQPIAELDVLASGEQGAELPRISSASDLLWGLASLGTVVFSEHRVCLLLLLQE